ncbi:MAG: sigma 54-interacting transcriptional regulator [Deltaproteobacteria bacterium]|nr:sigma 54-interacting transcriptional regulator [Deltaproteobacteria bacterium]
MTEESTRTILRPKSVPSGVRVVVVSGPATGAAAVGQKITLGRSRLADVSVADSTVSEFHLEILPHELGIEVRDLDSYNGTFFEGARIAQGVVPPGSLLSIGESSVRVDVAASHPEQTPVRDSFRGLLGKSQSMRDLYAAIERVGPTDLSVLVEGPTGSGKEVVAKALHEAGDPAKPFTVLDCASVPGSLAESVIFGHVRGAFTGATETRMGVFEAGDGGTVFLDEVGELPLALQPKLLRVLEQRLVTRIGETKPRPIDVRVVCATWRDLRRMVNQGHFRDDLYFRLAQVRLVVPSLAERVDDIELLAKELVRRIPRHVECARTFTREAIDELRIRSYPGNVRELKNVVERAAMLCDGPAIRPQDLAFDRLLDRGREGGSMESEETLDFKNAKRTAIDDFERDFLAKLLARTNGNIAQAAGLAAIERHYLRSLLKKHGLHE